MSKALVPVASVPTVVSSPKVTSFSDDSESQREFVRRRAGLDYELLCRTVADGLKAETVICNGKGEIMARVPANSERAKFVSVAAEILGAKQKVESVGVRVPAIVVVLPSGQRL